MAKKKDYAALTLIIFGIIGVVSGFFGELYSILKSTLTNQVLFGILLVIGILLLAFGIEKRR